MSTKCSVLNTKHDFHGAVIGMVLGDSRLVKHTNTCMCTTHKYASMDYLQWKANLVSVYLKGSIREIDNHGYPGALWYIPVTSQLNYLYNDFYATGKKRVTKHLLNRLTDLGLSIWYMDDGCLSYHRNRETGHIKARPFYLATHSFSYTENQMIKEWFADRYGIQVSVYRDKQYWRIYGNTTATRQLLDIVTPYVNQVDSMKYKIDMAYVRGPYLQHSAQHPNGMMI